MEKRWLEIVLNILFWALTTWLIASGFSIQSQEIEVINGVETINVIRNNSILTKLLICIGISIPLFYTNLWNILHLNKGKSKIKIIVISFSLFLSAIIIYYFVESLNISPFNLPLPTSISLGTFIFYYTISIAYAVIKVWQNAEHQRQKLALEKKQAELTLLRNQLQPHFLFNVLNNLMAIVEHHKNPVLASSLDRLSHLLRYVVYDTNTDKVAIKKEIEFIRNFAELQLLRFEQDEVKFKMDVNGAFDKQLVEPGIFIPFIENALKYGAEPERDSEIKVIFDLTNPSCINFQVINIVYPVMQKQNGIGTGIQSAKERLKLVYPDRHHLTITEDSLFTVELTINSNADNHS